jgi:hypothetical protein
MQKNYNYIFFYKLAQFFADDWPKCPKYRLELRSLLRVFYKDLNLIYFN